MRYALKTPYRDGTTHVIFDPEDFIARLAALVPKPRAHLTRYHGVFAPASPLRPAVVASGRGRGRSKGREDAASGEAAAAPASQPSEAEQHRALTWAQRLKRVFAIEIEICRGCGGRLRVIASIEAPPVIARILEHLGGAAEFGESLDPAHPSRAPPEGDLLL